MWQYVEEEDGEKKGEEKEMGGRPLGSAIRENKN